LKNKKKNIVICALKEEEIQNAYEMIIQVLKDEKIEAMPIFHTRKEIM